MNDLGELSDIFEDKGWHFDLPRKTNMHKAIFVEHLDRWLAFEKIPIGSSGKVLSHS